MKKLMCSHMTLIPIIVCLTILTYVDLFPAVIRYNLSYAVWAVAFVECVITCKLVISKQVTKYIGAGVFFIVGVNVLGLFSGYTYMGQTTYAVALALAIFFCGALLGNRLDQDDVYVICLWYVIASIIVAAIVFNKGIAIGFNLTSRQSFGVNKNSVGQILSTAACILIIGLPWMNKKIHIIIRIALIGFLSVMVFLIRSRTSILCFCVSILYIVVSKYTSKKIRRAIIIFGVILFLIIALNPTLRNTIIYNILLANRDATSLDSITSGRIDIYDSFDSLLNGHEFTGIGATYYESFYLSNIVQFGWILGLFLDFYAVWMVLIIRNSYKDLEYYQLLYVIAVSYALNGLFEGLPPFGPGTKNLLLWLLFGVATAHRLRFPENRLDTN